MTSRTIRPLALFAALLAALFLSACTSTEQQSGQTEQGHTEQGHTDHSHTESAGDAQAPHNADDITFARDMMPHHDQALQLVDLARDRSSDPALLELASGIAAAQGPEMEQLSQMLRSWGQDPEAGMDHGGHGMAMPGMVDDATMKRLESLSGREFDTLWLESMISHHQGAVEMAKAEIANGDNPEAKALAEQIVAAQEAEIARMKQMLEG
ncbi:hypothetical protein NIIDNTM18_01520 [Mycolicibacterium litorale]|uniref:DUF305 domain-containing protein n=1 Tax=Mycolicibacterium litorale TaxID=758802 RepID=A0A6S6NX00_9MYCO|nr:DUF305 domain-containing protein [Mycolicibacterium litorale]BCI50874.1 hypothetical protein NIIDNTM18_01520 [Mycolicibacterium litorale]